MNPERALQLKKMMEEDPNDPFCQYALALEYATDEAMRPKALELLKSLVANHSSYLPSYYQLVNLLKIDGEPAEAKKIAKAGLVLAEQQQNRHAHAEISYLLEDLEEL